MHTADVVSQLSVITLGVVVLLI